MEFHIRIGDRPLDIGAIEHAIQAIDSSAVVDVDPAGTTLRVAAAMDAALLVLLINQAGHRLIPDQVVQQPSICCGGCSG